MQMDQRTLNKTVISSLIGATIEWYDFFLFGVMAGVVLNKLYFPADDPTVSLMLAYATFAVGSSRARWAESCSATSATVSAERACWSSR